MRNTTRLTRLPPAALSAPTGGGVSPVNRWGAFCQLYVLLLAGSAVVVASRFRDALEERFGLDAAYIEATLRIPDASLDPADPFRNIAFVYRTLGLGAAPDVAAMVAFLASKAASFVTGQQITVNGGHVL